MTAKFFSALFAAVGLASPALAADLPARKAPVASPPAILANWSGFYVGVNAGATFGGGAVQTLGLDVTGIAIGPATAAQLNSSGTGAGRAAFVGGGQIGWNWQSGALVAGVEADIQGLADAGIARTQTSVALIFLPVASSVSTSRRLDYLGTVRGRIGWDVAPGWLLYATGGLAYGGVKASTRTFQANALGWGFGSSESNGVRVGWTIGAGVEWAFARNWSAKLEYLHYDLGRVSYAHPTFASIGAPIYATVGTSFRENGHLVRAGLNYRFGWGGSGPVVAKY